MPSKIISMHGNIVRLTDDLFQSGQIVETRAIFDRCQTDVVFAEFVVRGLQMHLNGNWGDLCDEDWELNQQALRCGNRLFSAYYMDDCHTEKIWIITEADRSVTTILFPEEY
jgi:hypothetical protein